MAHDASLRPWRRADSDQQIAVLAPIRQQDWLAETGAADEDVVGRCRRGWSGDNKRHCEHTDKAEHPCHDWITPHSHQRVPLERILRCRSTRSRAPSRCTRPLDLFLSREAAEAELREILQDEPDWKDALRVVPIELDGRTVSANEAPSIQGSRYALLWMVTERHSACGASPGPVLSGVQ
jgi:hypothetical protein